MNIDQSIKVSSWGNSIPINRVETHQIFQKYAQTQKNTLVGYQDQEQFKNLPTDQIQINSIQSGFRKLKNQQIQKLKDLKSQYEEIRKIATDYAQPRGSRTPSMHSSSQSQSQAILSPKESKAKHSSSREVQILQLQKKQLEIMIQNSMKKIEELLHNEMQYKKTIHELKLHKQSRNNNEGDNEVLNKLLKRKQKDFNERLKVLQIQRQNYFNTITTCKDRIKYLESSLINSEQQLRKTLQQKRNFEQLIRMQKDKYLNLQIQFRRQRRQHEIIQKDKNAQINRLLKLKDIKQSNIERDLKNKINDLQQQIKVKNERYNILLQKFDKYQKLQKQRLKQQKQNEIKVVNQLLTKSTSNNPQNKVFQQTILSILNRLTDLQKKPLIEIDNIVNNEHEQHQQIVDRLQNKINNLQKIQIQKDEIILKLKQQNNRLLLINQKIQKQLKLKSMNLNQYQQEISKLKKIEKVIKKDRSIDRLNDIKKIQPNNILINNQQQIKFLQNKINNLSKDNQYIIQQKILLQNQNRQLRIKINHLQFQIQKIQKNKQFILQLKQKKYQKQIENIYLQNQQLKLNISSLKTQLSSIKLQLLQNKQNHLEKLSSLNQTIDSLNRQKNNIDSLIKQTTIASLHKTKSDNTLKLNQLTTTIHNLTSQNQKFRLERQEYLLILEQNQRLIQALKKARYINGQCDRLWNSKEQQYQKIDNLLRTIRR